MSTQLSHVTQVGNYCGTHLGYTWQQITAPQAFRMIYYC